MSTFWNKRYSLEDYAYGTEPNQYLKSNLQNLEPGTLLLPGEGEGRNAVFAAELGWNVHAFDSSSVAAKKANKLSVERNVEIHYRIADIKDIQYPEDEFNCIAIIYLHLNPEDRIAFHKKMLDLLKPGGVLLLEAFSKKQIDKNSGGPADVNMLYSKKELQADFSSLSNLKIEEAELKQNEGIYHQGLASLIRVFAVK